MHKKYNGILKSYHPLLFLTLTFQIENKIHLKSLLHITWLHTEAIYTDMLSFSENIFLLTLRRRKQCLKKFFNNGASKNSGKNLKENQFRRTQVSFNNVSNTLSFNSFCLSDATSLLDILELHRSINSSNIKRTPNGSIKSDKLLSNI